MEDKDVEESIQKEDDIWLDRHAIQKHWLWCGIESIRHKSGLNHDQGIVNVFLVENTAVGTIVSIVLTIALNSDLPIESSFIRTIIEDLQELTPTKMEHELRIDTEVICQSEACGIFFPVVGEFLTQANEHAVQPAKDIW